MSGSRCCCGSVDEMIADNKLKNFIRNLEGSATSVTVDRWMYRALGLTDA